LSLFSVARFPLGKVSSHFFDFGPAIAHHVQRFFCGSLSFPLPGVPQGFPPLTTVRPVSPRFLLPRASSCPTCRTAVLVFAFHSAPPPSLWVSFLSEQVHRQGPHAWPRSRAGFSFRSFFPNSLFVLPEVEWRWGDPPSPSSCVKAVPRRCWSLRLIMDSCVCCFFSWSSGRFLHDPSVPGSFGLGLGCKLGPPPPSPRSLFFAGRPRLGVPTPPPSPQPLLWWVRFQSTHSEGL